jgi:Mg/Co/Ni transporter MgtE
MYTIKDFQRDYAKQHFAKLTPEEQREALELLSPEQRQQLLQSLSVEEGLACLPVEERLAGLSAEQIRQYLDQLTRSRPAEPRKPRRKK